MTEHSTEEARRGHLLTITKEADFDPEWPHFDYEVTCLAPDLCGGWEECPEAHEVDGVSAEDGPDECPEDVAWFDEPTFTFHGVEHEWRYSHGWTVPFPGCVVAANDYICDDAHDIGVTHGEGTHVVDDEWDEYYCSLIYVSTQPDSRIRSATTSERSES